MNDVAAIEAKLMVHASQLTLALEPEAASLCCRSTEKLINPDFKCGLFVSFVFLVASLSLCHYNCSFVKIDGNRCKILGVGLRRRNCRYHNSSVSLIKKNELRHEMMIIQEILSVFTCRIMHDGTLHEVCESSGGDWGSTKVIAEVILFFAKKMRRGKVFVVAP